MKKKATSSFPQTVLKWVLALVIFGSSAGWMVWKKEYTVSVRYGETRQATLANGVRVTLNGGSTVRIPFYFRSMRRQIWLKGEAFFDIAPSGDPWHIDTFDAEVEVHDGRLNIRAWPDDYRPETAVTLANGAVTVAKKGAEKIRLPQGHTIRVVKGEPSPAPPVSMPFERATAWLADGLYLEDRPLVDVLKTLERRYAVRVTVATEDLNGLNTTYVDPEPSSLPDILEDLCFALNLQYHKELEGYELSHR